MLRPYLESPRSAGVGLHTQSENNRVSLSRFATGFGWQMFETRLSSLTNARFGKFGICPERYSVNKKYMIIIIIIFIVVVVVVVIVVSSSRRISSSRSSNVSIPLPEVQVFGDQIPL